MVERDTSAVSALFCVVVSSADLPHAHASRRRGEGLAEQFADLVGVRSDLC